MDIKTKEILDKMTKEFRRTSAFVVIPLVVLVLVFGGVIAYLSMFGTYTRLIPSVIEKPMVIGRDYVDSGYLSEMADRVMWLRLNVSPSTAERNFGLLMKMVNPNQVSELNVILEREVKQIQKSGLSSAFYIKGVSIDEKNMNVKVGGLLTKWVDSRELPSQEKTYVIDFSLRFGAFQLESIREIKE